MQQCWGWLLSEASVSSQSPPARHQQVTGHQLKLLFRDPLNWGERAEVWFKSQQLINSQDSSRHVTSEWHWGLPHAQLLQGESPSLKGSGSCRRAAHFPAGSSGAHSALPARLTLLCSLGTPGGSAREHLQHLLLLSSLFKHNIPPPGQGRLCTRKHLCTELGRRPK